MAGREQATVNSGRIRPCRRSPYGGDSTPSTRPASCARQISSHSRNNSAPCFVMRASTRRICQCDATGLTTRHSPASYPSGAGGSPTPMRRSLPRISEPRAGESGGGSSGSPRCVRILRIGPGSVMNAMSRMSPPQVGHASENSSPTLAISLAQAIREVS